VWGQDIYGQPCRECGFSWELGVARDRALVAGLPAVVRAALGRATGDERLPELAWPVKSYVLHVGDNLRIWAERVAGISLGAPEAVGGYDENALAGARGYARISLPAALWSLERAVRDWTDAVTGARSALAMVHPERGRLALDDIVRTNAHDACHHLRDIRRILAGPRPDG
jgi:hypothetical protein